MAVYLYPERTLIRASVISELDPCNSPLYGLPKYSTKKVQHVHSIRQCAMYNQGFH